jgi:D-beta-D-heptose 7-phosphate kinase/D-beta-D-heptose 1-phosphate adenosyltransferase
VDHVLLFEEDTPEALIRRIKPDLHVKGGDYAGDLLIEESVVKEFGGEVVVLPLLPGRSASGTIEYIKSVGEEVSSPATKVRS